MLDSVLLQLCKEAGVKYRAFYTCTRIDPPEVYQFIKQYHPEVVWCYPKKSFWEYIQEHMPPLRNTRWCCDLLKKRPTYKIPMLSRVMGIRAEESPRRAARGEISKLPHKIRIFKPIFHWNEAQVWDFIESRSLPYCSLYDEGVDRIGCVVCPYILGNSRGATLKREWSMQRYPGIWRCFEKAVKRWAVAHGREDPEAFWQQYLNHFEKTP